MKMNKFNSMKHEDYTNNTLKFSSYITENTAFQLQGLTDWVCSAKFLLLLIWLVQVVHPVGSEEGGTASCLVTSAPDGGERSDSHWILIGPIPIHEESL